MQPCFAPFGFWMLRAGERGGGHSGRRRYPGLLRSFDPGKAAGNRKSLSEPGCYVRSTPYSIQTP